MDRDRGIVAEPLGAARAKVIERPKGDKETLLRFQVVAAAINPDRLAEARNKGAPPSCLYFV